MQVQTHLSEKKTPIGHKRFNQQIGHRDNRTLVSLLKQRGAHPWVLKMTTEHRCNACEESRPPVFLTKTFLVNSGD